MTRVRIGQKKMLLAPFPTRTKNGMQSEYNYLSISKSILSIFKKETPNFVLENHLILFLLRWELEAGICACSCQIINFSASFSLISGKQNRYCNTHKTNRSTKITQIIGREGKSVVYFDLLTNQIKPLTKSIYKT